MALAFPCLAALCAAYGWATRAAAAELGLGLAECVWDYSIPAGSCIFTLDMRNSAGWLLAWKLTVLMHEITAADQPFFPQQRYPPSRPLF